MTGLAAALLAVLLGIVPAAAQPTVGDRRLELPGGGVVPLFAEPGWDGGPAVRAVVVMHGLGRNARGYFASARRARDAAGAAALIVAPHILSATDPGPDGLLRWPGTWMNGTPALGPAPASAYDIIDAVLAHLADRNRFPALTTIVVVGHSAGAQVVQRYLAAGRGAPPPLAVRYVVANPSSYLWFGPDRPGPDGQPAPFTLAASCPGWNDWKYGVAGGFPPYVKDPPATLEARYLSRPVVYLLGTADTDPQERDLDRSCAGEAEGPNRFARGMGFLAHLAARHGPLPTQRLHTVPGVGHSAGRMFNSACGKWALFDFGSCP